MKKLLVSFLLLLPFCPAPVLHGEDYAVGVIGPFGYLNNTDNPLTIPADKAQDLLNVEVSPNGKSVKKREGFATALTTTITTSAVHGVYNFYESGGSDVSLVFNDRYMTSSVGGAAATVMFSTGPNGATYQCTDSAGFAYCANTSRTGIVRTTGSTYTFVTSAANGTMLTVTPERLVHAGFASFPNRIDFSKANDFTTWTIGAQATDPINFTITSPGAKVTHITYAFGRLMWFKDASFGYILEGNQPAFSDWQVVTVSQNLGTLDNTSVYDKGILYFRGQDSHIYAYDGSNVEKLTRDITTTVNASQSRTTNAFTQTTQANWQASSITPSGYLNTSLSEGSVVLDTAAAVSSFNDTSGVNFSSGTLTNLTTTYIDGSVELSWQSTATYHQRLTGSTAQLIRRRDIPGCNNSVLDHYQKFLATHTFSATSATLSLSKDAGFTGDLSVTLGNAAGSVANGSIGTSQGDVTVIFTSSVTLLSGTTYTLTIAASDVSDTGSAVYWYYDTAGAPYSLNATQEDSAGCSSGFCCSAGIIYGEAETSGRQYRYSVRGSTRANSGTLLSRSFDVGFATATWLWNWSTFSATATANGSTITYETQTASNTSGTWTTLASVGVGSSPSSTVQRYLRYKATFTNSYSTSSPRLNDLSIAMSDRRRPSGTIYSQVNNAPLITSWDSFTAGKQDNGGSHTFYVRAATGVFSIGSSTPAWTAINSGQTPTISTGVYMQMRDDFLITFATQSPILNDLTLTWFEGSAADKSYATYFNDALWWSVATGTGASTNNYIQRYDFLNNGWTLYDIPVNGFLVRNQRLYFGSATSGYLFKYGDVDNDNGEAINAYWKSKDFFGDNPFTDKEFVNLSLSAASVVSTMTVVYTLNGSSSTSFDVPLYNASSSFMRKNVNLPLGKVGSTFNVRFGNDAEDQSFEVFGISYGVRSKPWKPGN